MNCKLCDYGSLVRSNFKLNSKREVFCIKCWESEVMKPKFEDHPFWEVCSSAAAIMQDKEADVYQKFTCAGCGQRLTIDIPNKFYKTGTCDKCSTVTDIEKQGCNYLVHYHRLGDP